jgi:BTB/POZ domain-containing protein KCTD9
MQPLVSPTDKQRDAVSPAPSVDLVASEPSQDFPSRDAESPIILRVGERQFWTLPSTLTEESSYFASLLSGRWPDAQSEDGTFFIDADPGLFEHILRYLRHRALPVFWNGGHGFDYGLYAELLQEARYFGIIKLQEWITEKKYLRAISVQYSAKEIVGPPDLSEFSTGTDPHVERTYHVSWKQEKSYRCPRDISIHHGDPGRCGRACEKAKIDGQSDYENVQVMHTLVVDKKTMLNHTVSLVDGNSLVRWA